jgi:predicted transport protein
MPIFKIKNKKAVQVGLNISHFNNEAELRDFFSENLESLLGMRFLAKEFQTTDGRIDTLALDESCSPVIIEYKWGQDNAIVVQGLFYYDWLIKNKRHFDLYVADKLGKDVKVRWDNPRVILISQGFDNRTIAAVQQIENIELIKYIPYDNGLLYLENVYSSRTVKKNKEKNDMVVSGVAYNFDYHLGSVGVDVKEVFRKLREKIMSLPGVEEIVDQKTGITYRTTKSFVRFEFGKSYIKVLLREPSYNDPNSLVQDITSYMYGYRGQVKIKTQEEVDVIFDLVRQSYESTL